MPRINLLVEEKFEETRDEDDEEFHQLVRADVVVDERQVDERNRSHLRQAELRVFFGVDSLWREVAELEKGEHEEIRDEEME